MNRTPVLAKVQHLVRPASRVLRQLRSVWACAAAVVAVSSSAYAQATAYVPIDDPAYAYIAALQARGGLKALWALERPYTVLDIMSAMASDSVSHRYPGWTEALQRTMARYEPSIPAPSRRGSMVAVTFTPIGPDLRAALALDAFVTAQTSGLRELMLASNEGHGVFPGVSARVLVGSGNLVAVGRVIDDTKLRTDPEFAGQKERPLVGRSEDGYVLAHARFAQLAAGRLGRDWGPAHLGGLQIGPAPATYDHLYARIGGSRLRLSSMLARLSDYVSATGDTTAARFIAAHRIAFRFGGWEIAGTETMVYGGPGQGVVPPLSNPLIVFDAAQYNENVVGNVEVGLDVLLRTSRFGQHTVQLMLDDMQIDDCDPDCKEPKSWGATFSSEGVPLLPALHGFASYTRVTNLAYRTLSPFENYDHLGVALARAQSDYDEWRVGVESSLLPMPVRAYWARRRQGEGDYRLPFPRPAEYATTPEFLAGTVRVVNRFAIRSSGIFALGDLEADVGFNVDRNVDNVAGRSSNGFEGRVRAALRPRWLWRMTEEAR